MRFLRQSTAVTKKIGPFLDVGDGATEETGLAAGGTEISKNGAAFGTGPVLGTHDAEGWYPVALTTTHTNTVGTFVIKSHAVATHLPVWHEFTVVEEAVYDQLFASAAPGAATVAALSTAQTDLNTLTGTDGATLATAQANYAPALASVATEARLSELDEATAGKMANQVDIIQTDTTTDIPGTITTAQNDLNTITGADGVTLATAQALYAPAKATDVVSAGAITTSSGAVSSVTTVTTLSGHTAQTADHTGAIATIDTEVGAIQGDVTTLLGRVTATIFSGITSLAEWLGLLAGKQAADATALAEIKTSGAGSGTYSETTDSLEALRDTAPMGSTMVGTDSAVLASSAPTNWSSMGIEADGHVHGDLKEWLGTAPLALSSQRVQTSVAAIATAAITADAIATDAIGSAELAAGAAQKIRDEILPTQNVAFSNLVFLWVAASDHVTPVTGASTTSVTRSIDGGAFGSATGTLAEIGNGIYQFDASQADMNGGVIIFRFVATGGTPGAPDDAFVTIVTGGGV